ncbi:MULTISPECIES: hypothetical protein [Aeromonas]|uniref:hypothetical protein n=1 Tax=Aeromonas TaxID=642 RepID=UPI002B47C2A0|nr:hypothetical protein [Aeromonas caviae]MEE1910690.1 hypothetical protein [Aeromonas caviae]
MLIHIAKNAILNEIAIDQRLSENSGLEFKNKSIYKVIRFRNKIPLSFARILYLFAPVVFFAFFAFFVFKKITRARNIELPLGCIGLAFSERQKVVLLRYDRSVDCVMINDYLYKKCSITTAFNAYLDSCHIFYKLAHTIDRKYHLHFINTFEVILFNYSLDRQEKNSTQFIVCSHYDRWATVMLSKQWHNTCVVQHGILDNSFTPSVKLHAPQKLVCFSEKERDVFIKRIYLAIPSYIDYVRPKLNLDAKIKCDVLIINNPIYLKSDINIFKSLVAKNISVIFRPHPTVVSHVLNCIDEKYLSIGNSFPCPKVFVCRESTLGTEYEFYGYKGVWWNDESSLDDILGMISNCLT